MEESNERAAKVMRFYKDLASPRERSGLKDCVAT